MEFNFSLTKEDLKNFYIVSNRSTAIAWGLMLVVAIVSLILGIIGSSQSVIVLSVLLLGMIVIFGIYTIVKVIKAYKASVKGIEGKSGEVSLSIDEEMIQIKGGGKIKWEFILELLAFKSVLVFKLPTKNIFILPIRVMQEGQAEQIISYFKEGKKRRKGVMSSLKRAKK